MKNRFPFFIASRYFLSKKNKHFINTIAIISMLAVAFGTAALVIVLSVFNGFSKTIEGLYDSFDPEITILPKTGKVFEYTNELKETIQSTEGVGFITEVIQDNVLIRYKEQQKVVQLKAVSDNFLKQSNFKDVVLEGSPNLTNANKNFALFGLGIQYELGISLKNDFAFIQCWYPRRNVKRLSKNLARSFNQKTIIPGGVFQIEQQYDDNYVFVPLRFAQELINYKNERSSLEIKVKEGYKDSKVIEALQNKLGDQFTLKNKLALHANLYKAMRLEKLFVFLAIILVIAIASVNIFFSLSMLVIEKRKDTAMMITMGADTKLVKSIFLTEGLLVGLSGAAIGLMIGFLFCWIQQLTGFISMGAGTSIISAYPVSMQWQDFVAVGVSTFLIAFAASIAPAIKASKVTTEELRKL